MEAPSTPPFVSNKDNTSKQINPKLRTEFLFVVHQYLKDEYPEVAHSFETSSKIYFDFGYFSSFIQAGEWKKADQYFCAFLDPKTSKLASKVVFHLRKTWVCECVYNRENQKAFDILFNELSPYQGKKPYTELATLVTCKSIENAPTHKDFTPAKARAKLIEDFEKLLKESPEAPPMKYPKIPGKRLVQLLNQALNYQHKSCSRKIRQEKKDYYVETLFEDHRCPDPSTPASASSTLVNTNSATPMEIQTTPTPRPSTPPPQLVPESPPVQANPVPAKKSASQPKPPQSQTPVQSNGTSSESHTPLASNKRPLPSTEPPIQKKAKGDEVAPVVNTPPPEQIPSLIPEPKITVEDIPSKIATYIKLTHAATALRFHPTAENLLAVGTADGTTQLWDVSENKVLAQKSVGNAVKRFAWSPDGKYLAVAARGSLLYILELDASNKLQERMRVPNKHKGEINDVVFFSKTSDSQKKTYVVTGASDMTCGVFNVTDKSVVITWGEKEHDASVVSLITGEYDRVRYVAAACKNGKIHVYLDTALVDGKGLTSNSEYHKGIFSFALAGEDLVIAAENLWKSSIVDLKKNAIYSGYEPPSENKTLHVSIGKGHIIALPSKNQVKFWLKDDARLAKVVQSDWEIADVSFSASGNMIALSSLSHPFVSIATNAQVKLQKIQNKPELPEVPAKENEAVVTPKEPVSTPKEPVATHKEPQVTPKEPLKAAPASIDNRSGDKKPPLPSSQVEARVSHRFKYFELHPKEPRKFIGKIVFTQSGEGVALLADDKIHEVFKWSSNPSGEITSPVQHAGVVDNGGRNSRFYSIAITQNDLYQVLSVGDRIQLYQSKRLTYVSPEKITYGALDPRNPGTPTSLVLADDNNIFFVGIAEDCSIRIFNVSKHLEIEKLQGPNSRVNSMIFEASPTTLVSAHEDGKVYFFRLKKTTTEESSGPQKKVTTVSTYKLDTQESVRHLSLGDKPILGLSYRKAKKQILAIQKTGFHILDLESKSVIKSYSFPSISAGAFSQTEKPYIIYGTEDGLIAVVEVSPEFGLKPLHADKLPSGYASTISPHPSGESFAVGTSDGRTFVVQYPNS